MKYEFLTMELEEIKQVVQMAAGGKPAAFSIHLRQPLEYQSNRLFDVWIADRHWIVKEFLKRAELSIAPRREYQALEILAPLDLAPQPVFFDPCVGPVVIYEYLEGEMWDRQTPTSADLHMLAAAWLKIQTLQINWFSRGSERDLREIENQLQSGLQAYAAWAREFYQPGRKVAELCLNLFEKRRQVVNELIDHPPVYRFCRSDPRFANVIRRPGVRLGLVDWEDSGLRDPARELTDLITHPNQEDLLDWNGWQPFLEPYLLPQSEVDPHLEDRLHLYQAIFPFFWLTILMNRGINLYAAGAAEGWHVNGMPANQRLKRYLARAQAWPDLDFSAQLKTLGEERFFPGEA